MWSMVCHPGLTVWMLRGLSAVPCLPFSASVLCSSTSHSLTACKENIRKHQKHRRRRKERRGVEKQGRGAGRGQWRKIRKEGAGRQALALSLGLRSQCVLSTWQASLTRPAPGQGGCLNGPSGPSRVLCFSGSENLSISWGDPDCEGPERRGRHLGGTGCSHDIPTERKAPNAPHPPWPPLFLPPC